MSSEAKEFPATSYNDWLEKVKKDLRDKSFEDIVWDHSALGAIEPMYANDHSKEAVAIPPRSIQGKGNHWQIRQSFHGSGNNKNILDALKGGAEAVELQVTSDLQIELKNVFLDMIEVHLKAEVNAISALLPQINQLPSFKGSVNCDPVIHLLKTGEDNIESAVRALHHIGTQYEGVRSLTIDAAAVYEAGGNCVQEIAYTLCAGEHMLDAAISCGASIDEASAMVEIRLAAGSSYFETVAKMRAVRMMWAQLLEAYAPDHNCSVVVWIHAVGTLRTQSATDIHNNLLRATSSAMAAAAGGCDSLTIEPYTFPEADQDPMRYARNIQHMLRDESFFDEVEDAGHGSYYITELTDRMIYEAGALTSNLGQLGGFASAEGRTHFVECVTASARVLIESFMSAQSVLVGVNRFETEERNDLKEDMNALNPLEAIRLSEWGTQTVSAS